MHEVRRSSSLTLSCCVCSQGDGAAHSLTSHRMVQRFRCGPPLSREERQSQESFSSTTTANPCGPVRAHGPLALQAGEVEGPSSPVQPEDSTSSEVTVSTTSRIPRVSTGDCESDIAERAEQLISDR